MIHICNIRQKSCKPLRRWYQIEFYSNYYFSSIFITYNKNRTEKTEAKEFIINTSKLKEYVNNNVEEFVELETILEALDLTETIKAKPDYKEPYEDYI